MRKPDPIVEAVRNVRKAHAARFGYDLAAICKDLRAREQASGRPLARRAPKLRLKKTGS